MATYSQKQGEVIQGWRIVDATDQVLGRLASTVAISLRGKDKPTFTPNIDGGDFVIVVNAEKVHLTGAKEEKKIYYQHTRFRGGLKSWPAKEMRQKHPEDMIKRAVWGMLPKGALGRQMIKKLKVYRGPEHPHQAQQPKPLAAAR